MRICFSSVGGDLAKRKLIGQEDGSIEQFQLSTEHCLLFLHEHLLITGKGWVFAFVNIEDGL